MIVSDARSNRRRFLANTSALGAGSFLGLPRNGCTSRPRDEKIRFRPAPICLAPQYLAEDLLRLEGFSDVDYVSEEKTDCLSQDGDGPSRCQHVGRIRRVGRARCRQPGRADRRHSRGLLRAVCHGRDPRSQGPEGKDDRRLRVGTRGPCARCQHACLRGDDPNKDVHWLAGERAEDAMRLFIRRKSRRIYRIPSAPAGAAGEEDRSRHPGHLAGPPLVSVLLLHAGCESRLCSEEPESRPSGHCGPS